MNIGEAAKAAGVSAKMVRHYERIGLLPEAVRSPSGYRQFGEREVTALGVVRQARALGFSIDQIRELLSLWTNAGRRSSTVKRLALAHLADLEVKLQDILAMKRKLEDLVQACAGNDHAQCAILEGLESSSKKGSTRPCAQTRRSPR